MNNAIMKDIYAKYKSVKTVIDRRYIDLKQTK